jgi:hypothetical protein
MLVEFLKFFGRVATHNFVQLNIITLISAYYNVVQLTRR